ncbi:MAG: histidine triad nucleotide-binding protein [Phycisphaerae bacterium]|nr:histidine triad nucleotide-binding protein [Phycisphaerae bacterium]
MSKDCLFCKIIEGTIPSRKVLEDEHVFAFEDISPQAPTHILIVPRRHVATTNDLDPADDAIVGKMVRAAARIAAERGFADKGYRLVFNCNMAAGQAVYHIHLHLLGGRTFTWPPG